jgi:hypothetical protein
VDEGTAAIAAFAAIVAKTAGSSGRIAANRREAAQRSLR